MAKTRRGGGRKIQSFLAGDDVILDREFFLHDIAASKAHAQGLQHIGILSPQELDGLSEQLDLLAEDFRGGASCSTSSTKTATQPSKRD